MISWLVRVLPVETAEQRDRTVRRLTVATVAILAVALTLFTVLGGDLGSSTEAALFTCWGVLAVGHLLPRLVIVSLQRVAPHTRA